MVSHCVAGGHHLYPLSCRIQAVLTQCLSLTGLGKHPAEHTLARWLSWLEHHPVHRKEVAGLVPSRSTYRMQTINVSLSLSLSSIKTYRICSGEDLNKRKNLATASINRNPIPFPWHHLDEPSWVRQNSPFDMKAKGVAIDSLFHWQPLFLSRKTSFFYLTNFFWERERKGEERERNINVWLPLACPLLGTWPAAQACALDWESNWQPFGSQAGTQSTELHQPGIKKHFFITFV